MNAFVTDLLIVVKKELRELRHKPGVFLISFSSLIPFIFILVILAKRFEQVAGQTLLPELSNFLFTHYAVSFYFVAGFGLTVSLFYGEKVTKALEALLVTPLTPKRIWLGKSLFHFLWSVLFSVLGVGAGYLCLNVFVDVGTANITPAEPALFFFVCIFPILSFLLSAVVGLVNLISRLAVLTNTLFLMIGIGYVLLSSMRAESMGVTWALIEYYLYLILALILILLFQSRLLTRERIVLSA